MTLPVAKNCKMTKKSDIDDAINPSKMSDMPQHFLSDSNVSRGLYMQSLSPYEVFNLLAVANMSEKNTSRFIWGVHPLWGATETTFISFEK